MLASYLLLLIIGLSATVLGMKIREEVYRIAVVFSGGMLLAMGFILAPSPVQIGFVLLLLGLMHLIYSSAKILDECE
jgi:Ca2+/Na+ antiporter